MATVDQRRREEAATSLAKKIRLESRIENAFNRQFRKIGRSLRALYSATGTAIRASQFQNETRLMLQLHYDKVMSEFRGEVARSFKFKKLTPVEKQANQEFQESNVRFVENQSKVQSERITNTSQNEIDAAIALSIVALIEDQQPLTNENIGRLSEREFIRRSSSRAQTISITETQNPAEQSKLNQMIFLVSLGIGSRFASRKLWTAILDRRVRDSHASSDGQARSINENFTVMGEQLRHPGDTSQGASASNVINCRCSSMMITGA